MESSIILVQNKLEQEAMERAEKRQKEAEEAAKLKSQAEVVETTEGVMSIEGVMFSFEINPHKKN